MTLLYILLGIYLLSSGIVAGVHWAEYHDAMSAGHQVSMRDRVMTLFILPMTPVINTIYAIGYISEY